MFAGTLVNVLEAFPKFHLGSQIEFGHSVASVTMDVTGVVAIHHLWNIEQVTATQVSYSCFNDSIFSIYFVILIKGLLLAIALHRVPQETKLSNGTQT